MVAVPLAEGVKTPVLLTLPMPEGLTDHVTELLKLPVPETVGVQLEVWFVWMEDGEQVTETLVIVGAAVMVTEADPDLLVS